MRDYVIRLESYGISRERARELAWACRQYDQCRRKALAIRRGEPVDDKPRRGNRTWRPPDPTGDAAIRIADNRYARRVAAIEASAKAADPALAKHIIRNACRGVPFALLDAPCSQPYFSRARRRFFVELDARMD
jgi:hypothetical protein